MSSHNLNFSIIRIKSDKLVEEAWKYAKPVYQIITVANLNDMQFALILLD